MVIQFEVPSSCPTAPTASSMDEMTRTASPFSYTRTGPSAHRVGYDVDDNSTEHHSGHHQHRVVQPETYCRSAYYGYGGKQRCAEHRARPAAQAPRYAANSGVRFSLNALTPSCASGVSPKSFRLEYAIWPIDANCSVSVLNDCLRTFNAVGDS